MLSSGVTTKTGACARITSELPVTRSVSTRVLLDFNTQESSVPVGSLLVPFDMAFNGAMPTHGNQTSPGRYSGSDNGWIGILVMPPLVQFFEGTQNTPQPSLRALRRSGDRTHLERAAIAPTIWSHECSLSRYGKALWSLLDNNFDLRGALSLLPIVRIFLTD
jgi:hypothetical protein